MHTLTETAVNNSKNQKNQHSDNSNSDYPICSHPGRSNVSLLSRIRGTLRIGGTIPTSHTPQGLDTRINITLALMQILPRMLNRLSLLMQIRQRTTTDIFCFKRKSLTFL